MVYWAVVFGRAIVAFVHNTANFCAKKMSCLHTEDELLFSREAGTQMLFTAMSDDFLREKWRARKQVNKINMGRLKWPHWADIDTPAGYSERFKIGF